MSGAVTGSTILDIKDSFSDNLKVVTLTINNMCNSFCNHCYLNYNSEKLYISESIVEKVLESGAEKIVVVGKEPFYDENSVSLLKYLIKKGKEKGKKISVITNGINLDLMEVKNLKKFENLDISIHSSNGLYRKKFQFKKIVENMKHLDREGANNVNILSVVDNETIDKVEEIIAFSGQFKNVKRVLFSLFLNTERGTPYRVRELDIDFVIERFKNCRPFIECANAYLLLDMYHFVDSGVDPEIIDEKVKKSGIEDKVRFIKTPPTLMGVIRVSHDGLLMTSYDALHTANYRKFSIYIEKVQSVDRYYNDIVSRFNPFVFETAAI